MLLEASQEAGALPFMLLDRRLVGAHASCPTRTWCIRGAPRADETWSSAARNAQCRIAQIAPAPPSSTLPGALYEPPRPRGARPAPPRKGTRRPWQEPPPSI